MKQRFYAARDQRARATAICSQERRRAEEFGDGRSSEAIRRDRGLLEAGPERLLEQRETPSRILCATRRGRCWPAGCRAPRRPAPTVPSRPLPRGRAEVSPGASRTAGGFVPEKSSQRGASQTFYRASSEIRTPREGRGPDTRRKRGGLRRCFTPGQGVSGPEGTPYSCCRKPGDAGGIRSETSSAAAVSSLTRCGQRSGALRRAPRFQTSGSRMIRVRGRLTGRPDSGSRIAGELLSGRESGNSARSRPGDSRCLRLAVALDPRTRNRVVQNHRLTQSRRSHCLCVTKRCRREREHERHR
jgi:hypothetical protein